LDDPVHLADIRTICALQCSLALDAPRSPVLLKWIFSRQTLEQR